LFDSEKFQKTKEFEVFYFQNFKEYKSEVYQQNIVFIMQG
jgi:hypothetical protein